MEIQHDASSAFDLHFYLLSKLEEYSKTNLNVFDFAKLRKLNTWNYKHFVLPKFDTHEMQNFFNEKQLF